MNPGCTYKYLFLIAAVLSQCVTAPLYASGQKDCEKTQCIAAVHAAESHTREQVKLQKIEEQLLHEIPEKGNIRHSTGHYGFLFSLKRNGIISNRYASPEAGAARHGCGWYASHPQPFLPCEALRCTPLQYERFYYRQRETYSRPSSPREIISVLQLPLEFTRLSCINTRQQAGHNPSQIKTPGALS